MIGPSERKALFFDIDGTLLTDEKKELPESAKNAIEAARRAGHLVFINSGRARCLMQEIDIIKVEDRVMQEVHAAMDENQRDYFIREQIKALSKEIDEDDERIIKDKALDLLEGPGGMWDKEDLDNPDFMEVAQEMADELNEYIEEEEDC